MSDPGQLYVKLVDEAVDVWRPVAAEHLQGSLYRIVEQPYDRSIEAWEFEPGDIVVAEPIEASDGTILAATRLDQRQ